MTIKVSALTEEFIRVPVSATEDGEAIDPTTGDVAFAFVEAGDPEAGDWQAGTWEEASGSQYFARFLTGTLAEGRYWVWLRVTKGPETVVRRCGVLVVA